MSSYLQILLRLPLEGIIVIVLIVIGTVRATRVTLSASRRLSAECERLERLRSESPPHGNLAALMAVVRGDTVLTSAIIDAARRGRVDDELLGAEDWNGESRYLAGIFVFVGLCGTVLGIARSVTNLGAAVSVASVSGSGGAEGAGMSLARWAGLLSGIDSLLAGMQSASVCTFVGIAATVFVSFMNHRLESRCARWLQDAHAEIARLLEPTWAATATRAANSNLSSAAQALSSAAFSLSEQIGPATEHLATLAVRSEALASQLTDTSASLQVEGVRVSEEHERLRDSLTHANEVLRTDLARLGELAASMTVACSVLANSKDSTATIAVQVREAFLSVERSVRELREGLINDGRSQKENLSALVERVAGISKGLDGLLRRFETTLVDAAQVDRQSVDVLAKQMKDLQDRIARASRSLADNQRRSHGGGSGTGPSTHPCPTPEGKSQQGRSQAPVPPTVEPAPQSRAQDGVLGTDISTGKRPEDAPVPPVNDVDVLEPPVTPVREDASPGDDRPRVPLEVKHPEAVTSGPQRSRFWFLRWPWGSAGKR